MTETEIPIDMLIADTSEPFFRTNNGMSEVNRYPTFTSFRGLKEEPKLRTPLFKEMIDYIPEEELAQFGVASVKSLIK